MPLPLNLLVWDCWGEGFFLKPQIHRILPFLLFNTSTFSWPQDSTPSSPHFSRSSQTPLSCGVNVSYQTHSHDPTEQGQKGLSSQRAPLPNQNILRGLSWKWRFLTTSRQYEDLSKSLPEESCASSDVSWAMDPEKRETPYPALLLKKYWQSFLHIPSEGQHLTVQLFHTFPWYARDACIWFPYRPDLYQETVRHTQPRSFPAPSLSRAEQDGHFKKMIPSFLCEPQFHRRHQRYVDDFGLFVCTDWYMACVVKKPKRLHVYTSTRLHSDKKARLAVSYSNPHPIPPFRG